MQTNHYPAFMADFSMDQVEEKFLGSLKEGFNACVECCDKQVQAGKGDEIALYYEGIGGVSSTHSWVELQKKSAQFANFLKSQGVKAGDRISCMLPRTPDLLVVVLGTWRIGAVYQPLFTAFGYEAIEYRITQCDAKVVVTDDANRSKFDQVNGLPTVVQVCADQETAEAKGDLHFDTVMASFSDECEPVVLDAEQPFLQMFTSGTVGKSKRCCGAFEGAAGLLYLYEVCRWSG
ncbi:AMP-binding protein [Oceanospirillum beijerinckii]|uniref:AMP-binding protein n=1 Tax=Oceanospirillum beijerinckii TaxID=64976 RepID=UPI000429C366